MLRLDWESIKKDYEEEGFSINVLARNYNCAASTIYNRACAEGWLKPSLEKKIDINEFTADPIPDSPGEIVENNDDSEKEQQEKPIGENNEEQAPPDIDQLTIENAIYRQKCLLARLMHELETSTSHIGQMKKWIIEGTKDDRSLSRRRAMYQAVSMGKRTVMLKDATIALKNLCEIEGMSGIKPRGKKATIEAEAQALSKQIFETPDMPGKIAA